MASVVYHVVVAFDRNEEGELEPGEGIEAPSVEAAKRRALAALPKHAGAVAFTRIGDPATGDFSPAAIIVQAGDVDLSALAAE